MHCLLTSDIAVDPKEIARDHEMNIAELNTVEETDVVPLRVQGFREDPSASL